MIHTPKFDCVLFDLDDTLLNRDAAIVRFCKELYRTKSAINQANNEAEAIELILSFDNAPREDFLADVERQWPGVFGSPESAMLEFSELIARANVLEHHTRQTLLDLRARGIPCGIVTNGGTNAQMGKVRQTGLDSLVQAVVVSETVDAWKPDSRIFNHTLEQLGADPSKTLFVGDNPEADILGSKSVGMSAAWVRLGREWPFQETRPDYVVNHVTEVMDLLFD